MVIDAQHSANGSLPSGDNTGSPNGDGTPEQPEVLQRFWVAVKRLPAYVHLVATIARDPDVPNSAKMIVAAGSAYLVSPIDFVPGFIPVAGQLDDLYVFLTAIQQSLRRTPDDTAARLLEQTHIRRDDIDGDLQAVRDLVRVGVKKSVVLGGKALGRVSRAAIRFADTQFKHRSTKQGAGTR